MEASEAAILIDKKMFLKFCLQAKSGIAYTLIRGRAVAILCVLFEISLAKFSTLRPRLFPEGSRGLFVSLQVNAKQDLELDLYSALLQSFQFIVQYTTRPTIRLNII